MPISQVVNRSSSNCSLPTNVRKSEKTLFKLVLAELWGIRLGKGPEFKPISSNYAIELVKMFEKNTILKIFFGFSSDLELSESAHLCRRGS